MGFEKTAVINKTIETPDKQNAIFVAGERLNLADTDPNYPGRFSRITCWAAGF